MGYFNRDNNSGGRGNYGNRSFGGSNSDREMFKATCADCGKACEIPFKPSTGRPVYCSDCFRKHSPDEGRGRNTYQDRNRSQSSHGAEPRPFNNPPSPQLNDINAKLDRILELLSPTPKKPIQQAQVEEIQNKKNENATLEEISEPSEEITVVSEKLAQTPKPKAKKKATKSK